MVQQIDLSTVRYNRRAGRFIGPGGGFLSNSDVQSLVAGEQGRLNNKIQRELNGLFTGRSTIKDVQLATAQHIKESQLRAITLGAGGKESLRSNPELRRYFGQAGGQLKRQYQSLSDLGQKIAAGELSEAQIRDRFHRQSLRIYEGFNRSELLTKVTQQGHNEGRRTLQPGSNHCPDCPAHVSNGWVQIGDIVPVGTACVCGGYCNCNVVTRFNRQRAIAELQGGNLTNQVLRLAETQQQAISAQN